MHRARITTGVQCTRMAEKSKRATAATAVAKNQMMRSVSNPEKVVTSLGFGRTPRLTVQRRERDPRCGSDMAPHTRVVAPRYVPVWHG